MPKKEFIRDNPYPFTATKHEKRIYDLEGIVGGIAIGSNSTALKDGTKIMVSVNLNSGEVEAGSSFVYCKKKFF